MSIEFDKKDSINKYLNEKLDNLLSGINESYGQILLEELVVRLKRTLDDFTEEIESIVGDLKNSSERRNKIIHDLMEERDFFEESNKTKNNEADTRADTSQMSEWEKRLEGI